MRQHIEDARQGDRQAFEHIVRHYTSMASAVAYDKLNDFQLAEDAVQEAFTEAFLHLNKLKTAEAFPGWFKAIVARQCYRILRKKQHRAIPFDSVAQLAEAPYSVSDIIEQKEMQQLVHNSIADLTPNMRIAVQLFYFQGHSLQEISSFLGTKVPVLKKRLFDARRKLKGALPITDVLSVFNHLFEGGKGVLHIVNGDSVAEKLRQGVVHGDILVWREVYPHGPVFPNPTVKENRTIRAQYLEQTIGVPGVDYMQISEAQEKALADFHKYEEVVLWFEHDLFDQTMLCFLLDWFSSQALSKTKLSLLCIGEFPGIELFRGLGQLSLAQMETLPGTWKAVGVEEQKLGSAWWRAYTSPDPSALQHMLNKDTSALPFAHDAFQFHLSRFPSTDNGLGIVEQVTLERVQAGISSPYKLFEQVGNKLHTFGMGDLQYWHILMRMSEAPHPLLLLEGLDLLSAKGKPLSPFPDYNVALTGLGAKVLAGDEDWTAIKGIDEWYGGIHLQGYSPRWRWNSSRQMIDDLGAGL
jgi:RNA polymerase sigma factor (sigma-70 family)